VAHNIEGYVNELSLVWQYKMQFCHICYWKVSWPWNLG